jgi:FkbH-like protein
LFNFNQLKKNGKKDFSGMKKIKLAILADNASQLLHQAIKGYGYEAQINFEIYEADYNQIDRQVYDPTSELHIFKPEYVFINRSSEHLIKKFYKLGKIEKQDFALAEKTIVRNYYETLFTSLNAKIIINTFPEINDAVFGNFSSQVDSSFVYQIKNTNLELMRLSSELKNLFICDISSLTTTLGYQFTFDPKMYVNADMVYSIDFLPHIAQHLTSIIQSISGTFKKCLILDLDNTIWGGIIGDDGIEGIQLGELGIGKAFTEFQLWAKQLKNRGIILAVCSKNTEEIAKEPFMSHPEMILRLDDIALFVANWENKVDNIRHIQSVLNIGFDSMVFLDDNPFEREMVKREIPELTIPDMPEDPSEYLSYLRSLNLFETSSYTEEDEKRTNQYQDEAQRSLLQKTFTSEKEFLENLEMASEVSAFNGFTIPRVAQLTQRSNQFNLRTIRYTEEDIQKILESAEFYTFSITLEDKFGDHGLIGVVILKQESKDVLFIDTWIMSCRVLKRGVENFTLNTLVSFAKEKGFKMLEGEYIPTRKNIIVENHFADLGFISKEDKWILDLEMYKPKENFIQLKSTAYESRTDLKRSK